MTLYHGTIDALLPSILKNGLRPTSDNTWKAVKLNPFTVLFGLPEELFLGYNPSKDDAPGYVYVTPNHSSAAIYAKAKAAYFRTMPRGTFNFGYADDMIFRKMPDAPVIETAKPVILTITPPSDIVSRIEKDIKSSGYRFYGSIGPQFIRQEKLLAGV